jgi:hypothetical protein
VTGNAHQIFAEKGRQTCSLPFTEHFEQAFSPFEVNFVTFLLNIHTFSTSFTKILCINVVDHALSVKQSDA